jgi:hypothetical protein
MPTGEIHSQYIVSYETSRSWNSLLNLTPAPPLRTVMVNISCEQDSKVAYISDHEFARVRPIVVSHCPFRSSVVTELYKMAGLNKMGKASFLSRLTLLLWTRSPYWYHCRTCANFIRNDITSIITRYKIVHKVFRGNPCVFVDMDANENCSYV